MAMDRETYIDVFHNVTNLEREGLPVQTYWHTAIGPAPGWRLDPKDSKFGENAKYFKYDVGEAKKLLAAAGYGNGLEIITSYIKGTELNTNGSNFQKTAEVRQDMLRAIGVKPQVNLIDYTTGGLGGFVNANPGLADFTRHGLLGDRLRGVSFDAGAATWSIDSARNALGDYLAYDRDTQFVSEYLVKVDGSTMHYALEARAPFLDHVLWEYAASLPFDVRLRGGVLKAVLREIARRRIGPRVADGSKRGFSIPVEAWMANRWRGRVAESLSDSVLVSEGWVERGPLQRELATATHRGQASRRLWYLWVLEEWMRLERTSRSASGRTGGGPPGAVSSNRPREASWR